MKERENDADIVEDLRAWATRSATGVRWLIKTGSGTCDLAEEAGAADRPFGGGTCCCPGRFLRCRRAADAESPGAADAESGFDFEDIAWTGVVKLKGSGADAKLRW